MLGGGGGGGVVDLSYSLLGRSESFQSDSSQEAMGGEAEGWLGTLASGRLYFPEAAVGVCSVGCRLFQVGTVPGSLPLCFNPEMTLLCTCLECHLFSTHP